MAKTKLKLARGDAFLAATHLRAQISAYRPEDLEKNKTLRDRQSRLIETAFLLEAFALGGRKIVEATQ